MPLIAFVSPKSSSDKIASALVLAAQLARNADVTVIDANLDHPLKEWTSDGSKVKRMTIVSNVDETNIESAIESAEIMTPFVIVDLEVTTPEIAFIASSRADLVIVPTRDTLLGVKQAKHALHMIREQAKRTNLGEAWMLTHPLPCHVLFTRINGRDNPAPLTHKTTLLEAEIPVFETEFDDMDALRTMISLQSRMSDLSTACVEGFDHALSKAEQFAQEVIHAVQVNLSLSSRHS